MMNRVLRLFACMLTACVLLAVPFALGAQATTTEAGNLLGVTVIVKGAVQPIVQHALPAGILRAAPAAFAVELDAFYRLPLDRVDIDVGVGLRYLFDRAIDGGAHPYSLIPVYALVQLPFGIPSFEGVWEIYIDGRLGYAAFLPSNEYTAQYLTGRGHSGGVYLAAGLGTVYHFSPRFEARLLVSYNAHLIPLTTGTMIEDTVFEISAGVGFVF